jgi:hypothetical protein
LDFAVLVFCRREVELMAEYLSATLKRAHRVSQDYGLLRRPAQAVGHEQEAFGYQMVKVHLGIAGTEL